MILVDRNNVDESHAVDAASRPYTVTRFRVRLLKALSLTIILSFLIVADAHAQNELAKQATWDIPSLERTEKAVAGWLDEAEVNSELRTKVLDQLRSAKDSAFSVDPLETVLTTLQIVRPEIGGFLEQARQPRNGLARPDFSSILNNDGESYFVRQHVRLLYGRWLAQNDFLDEALEQLNQVRLPESLDPVSLLFYRGVTEHQLLKQEECVATLKQLLENESLLPKRYAILGRLMVADIEPMEADSLDEISRLMRDIRRRQSLYRSGTRVRGQEEDVINKLDKIIEKLEQQAQSQKQQQNGSMMPSSPMEDSRNASGQGTGEAIGRSQEDGGNWGALPPAERAAAMAEMSKDLPPHYRAVIEEYFRKLARDDEK